MRSSATMRDECEMKKQKWSGNQAILRDFRHYFCPKATKFAICSLTTVVRFNFNFFFFSCPHFAYSTKKATHSQCEQYCCEAKLKMGDASDRTSRPRITEDTIKTETEKMKTKTKHSRLNHSASECLCVCGLWQILFRLFGANYGYLLVKIILCAVIFPLVCLFLLDVREIRYFGISNWFAFVRNASDSISDAALHYRECTDVIPHVPRSRCHWTFLMALNQETTNYSHFPCNSSISLVIFFLYSTGRLFGYDNSPPSKNKHRQIAQSLRINWNWLSECVASFRVYRVCSSHHHRLS